MKPFFPFLSHLLSQSSQYFIVDVSLANSMTIWCGLTGPFLLTHGNLWMLFDVRLLLQLTVSGEPKNCILIFVFPLWLQSTVISIQLTHNLPTIRNIFNVNDPTQLTESSYDVDNMYLDLLLRAFEGHRHQLEALCNRKLKLNKV